MGIPLHDLLLKLRNRQVQEGVRGRGEHLAFKGFENTMKNPALLKISGKVGRVAQKPLVREDSVRPLPGPALRRGQLPLHATVVRFPG